MRNGSIKIFKYWGPVVFWAGLIFYLSSLPPSSVTGDYWTEFAIKKTAHVIEYGVLATLLYRAFRVSVEGLQRQYWLSAILSSLYGATDEFHQSFIPGREPRGRDVIFDTIGAVLAIYIIWKLLPKAPKRLKTWAKKLQLI